MRMISKFKNKKTCKRLGLVNSQKGGSKNPYGFNPKKVTTKNLKKVVQSALLSKFSENYKSNPANLDKYGKIKWKNYSKAYKEHISKLNSNLQLVTPPRNQLWKSFKRMNKFRKGKKFGLNEIYGILSNKANDVTDFARSKSSISSNTFSNLLSRELSRKSQSNMYVYGTQISKDKHKQKIISKIVSVLRPQSV